MDYIKRGQIVYFRTPNKTEIPKLYFLVLEMFEDSDGFKAKLQAAKSDTILSIVKVAPVEDLKVDAVQTRSLLRYMKRIEEGEEFIPKSKTNIESLFGL